MISDIGISCAALLMVKRYGADTILDAAANRCPNKRSQS